MAGHSMRRFFESRWAEFYSNKDKQEPTGIPLRVVLQTVGALAVSPVPLRPPGVLLQPHVLSPVQVYMYRFWLFVCYCFLDRWNLFYRQPRVHSDDMSVAVNLLCLLIFTSSPHLVPITPTHPRLITNSERGRLVSSSSGLMDRLQAPLTLTVKVRA